MRRISVLLLLSMCAGADVLRVDIDRIVHPITVEIVRDAIRNTRETGAEALLIRLNTPGGLYDASREIVQELIASPVPVITWVGPGGARAASAGFFLLLAGDVAAMASGTRTGAASPVLLGGEMDPVMRRKAESDASAWIRSLAAKRGRNAAAAESTVLGAKSFTEQEALRTNLIDLVADNESDLLQKLQGRQITRFSGTVQKLQVSNARVRTWEPTVRQKVLKAISDPNIAFILLILGALGLYLEFTTPGAIFPGVAGAILGLLGLSALSVLPINWLGAALILLALGLFVAEAFVTSHGVLGVGGAVSLIIGALLLVDGPPGMRITPGTALGVGLPFAAIVVFLATLVVRAHRHKVATGDSGLIGVEGVARTPLEPAGKVYVHGEYWDASSPVPVAAGSRVRVLAVDGLKLRVEPAP